MVAARTPVLGIAIAVVVLIAENLGAVALVAAADEIETRANDRATARTTELARVRLEIAHHGCRR